MRLARDENTSSQQVVPALGTFQGLVLQARAAGAPGSDQWESEVDLAAGGVDPREPLTLSRGFRRDHDQAWAQQRVVPMRQLLQRSLDEDKPPAISNNNDKDDTMNTGPATRSRTRTAPAVLIELPKQSDAEDENDEEEESKKEEEDEDSPSSASSGTKKPRKRPHYLSHEDRCQIIERIAGGEQQAALAREFGVTRAAVCHIQKHRFEILSRPVAQETILIEDVLGQLDARTVEITTTTGYVTTGIEQRYPLCGVKLGDEGYPFSVLFHQVEVDAAEVELMYLLVGMLKTEIRVVTAAIDKSIDPRTEEIIPGLGDFIARYNDEDAGT
ncbi:hypothetical protein ON010_g1059 [Phytophthora cinnamomi]|nr:hypothetical protein ON010_g1059 [Phytophthora cinnamomi]